MISSQTEIPFDSEIVKQFYRKTKLIQRNQIKTIWEVTHIYTGDVVVAKLQPIKQGVNERTVLHQGKFLQHCQGSPGIPFLVWCGKGQIQKQDILIEQKLGKTLKQIIDESPSNKLSLKSAIMIGIQLMKVISCYHEKGYIYRNVNLDTVQFGCGSRCDKLYLNDFIDSRSYFKKNTFQHIDRKTGVKVRKPSQCSSYDTLDGIQSSRKDDIESIILLLIKLIKGNLPWSPVWDQGGNLKTFNSQKTTPHRNSFERSPLKNKISLQNSSFFQQNKTSYDKIQALLNDPKILEWKVQKKIQVTKSIMQLVSAQKLCQSLPQQLKQIYLQVKSLQFTQKPNYILYIQKLNAVLIKNGWQNDSIFDWMKSSQVSKPLSQGGLNIKELQWLIKANDHRKSKLVQFENEQQVLSVYQKIAPFIQIDKLGGL